MKTKMSDDLRSPCRVRCNMASQRSAARHVLGTPLPLTLNHIQCWLRRWRANHGDCGANTDEIFEIWDKLWKGVARGPCTI